MESQGDICATALVKGSERYVFLFDVERRGELMKIISRHAADPHLSLSWRDAAMLVQHVQHGKEGAITPRERKTVSRKDFDTRGLDELL